MAVHGRNLGIAAGMVLLLAVGAALLPSSGWVCGLTVLLGLAGVVLLRGNGWRSAALLVAAVALAVGLLDLLVGAVSPEAHGTGLVTTYKPKDWTEPDPDLGFRPRPDSKVAVTATYDAQTVFDVTYPITAHGTRITPSAPPGADTYLFIGDSFMFGHGLADEQTLPAQFARAAGFTVRAVNFSAPSYAPNQFVRLLESGHLDWLRGQPVKMVVSWIIPPHLARVTGDEPWLGASPRYVLEDGVPRFTGSFDHYRWTHPLSGLRHFADDQFPFVAAIGLRQRQARQAELFTALMMRLQQLAREKFGAPLLVLYSWPDERSPPDSDGRTAAQPMLVSVLKGLRQRGLRLMAVNDLMSGRPSAEVAIPHDGHPTAFADGLLAAELEKRLVGP
jgi:hypothetical protein